MPKYAPTNPLRLDVRALTGLACWFIPPIALLTSAFACLSAS